MVLEALAHGMVVNKFAKEKTPHQEEYERIGSRQSPKTVPDMFVKECFSFFSDQDNPMKELTTTIIFASQILLDIHEILEDQVHGGWEELVTFVRKAQATLEMKIISQHSLEPSQYDSGADHPATNNMRRIFDLVQTFQFDNLQQMDDFKILIWLLEKEMERPNHGRFIRMTWDE